MSREALGAQRMIEDIAKGLDVHIRAAAAAMLTAQEKVRRAKVAFGPTGDLTMVALLEMSMCRGVFDGLVQAWELVTHEQYPAEEVASGWLDQR